MIRYLTYIITGLCMVLQSCDRYLDVKPRSNLVVPETLDDMEQLLDHGGLFNSYPELLELQADDFYFKSDYWNTMPNLVNKNAYVWAGDIYGTNESHQVWSDQYIKIFYANAVLDGLNKMERRAADATRYDQIKGSALFLKAEAVYLLAQLFAKVYDIRTADTDLGIPIPTSADVNEKLTRPSNQFTFDFITNSLLAAEKLILPVADFSRPSKPAASALLARVYLYMGDYKRAGENASMSLSRFNEVIDLDKASKRSFKQTLLCRFISPTNDFYNNIRINTIIDTNLMMSYHESDLRKLYYFEKKADLHYVKNNSHDLGLLPFAGLDSDEQYLIRAECYAREDEIDLALADLNHLLKNRFANGTYSPYASLDRDKVLHWILEERRKELVFRGLRWPDLKRLNREGEDITLHRVLGDQVFALPPNHPKWVLPIPLNEINISKLIQNER